MSPTNKRVVAFWSYYLTTKKKYNSLYDRDNGIICEYEIEKIAHHLSLIEHPSQARFSIIEKSNNTEFFNHKMKKSFDLETYKGFFKGYDYASSEYFMVHLNDKEVKIYDYETDDFHFFDIRTVQLAKKMHQ